MMRNFSYLNDGMEVDEYYQNIPEEEISRDDLHILQFCSALPQMAGEVYILWHPSHICGSYNLSSCSSSSDLLLNRSYQLVQLP